MDRDDLEQAHLCLKILEEALDPILKWSSNAFLRAFGSIANTFSVKGSHDIDVVLFIEEHKENPHAVYQMISVILRGISSEPVIAMEMERLFVIGYSCRRTGFKVEIALNNIVGIFNTSLIWNYAMID